MNPHYPSRYRLSLIGLALLSAGMLLLVLVSGTQPAGATPKKTPTRTPTPVPTTTPVPNPPPNVPGTWKVVNSPSSSVGYNTLRGVDAVSANDVWAVGDALIEHWDGAAWSLVAAAPGGNPPQFKAVTALANDDVWAVGQRSETVSPYYYKTLVEHWDGTAWSVVPSPNGSPQNSQLLGVDAVSPNDIWAVGDFSVTGPVYYQTLIEHWDGSTWSVVPSPNVSGSSQNTLTAVSAVSATDVWAVGYHLASNWRTLVMRWNGSAWSIVPSPNIGPYGNYLYAVDARASNDVWAVGTTNNSSQTLILHWDGSSWSVVASPSISNWTNVLHGVSIVSANDIWAVGLATSTYYVGDGDPITSSQTLILHWNGSVWSIVPSPNPGNSNNYYGTITNELHGVVSVSAGDAWAVGMYGLSDGLNVTPQTLVERYTIP